MIFAALVLPIPGGPLMSTAFLGASFPFGAAAWPRCVLAETNRQSDASGELPAGAAPLPLVQPHAQVGDELAVAHQLRNALRLVLLDPQLIQNRACAWVQSTPPTMNAQR